MKLKRLRRREIKEVIKFGEKIKIGEFLVKWKEGGKKERIGFGVLSRKKIFKKAVLRNRLKRLIREALRKNLNLLQKEIDLVFIPLSPSILEFSEIEKKVKQILEKINAKSNP